MVMFLIVVYLVTILLVDIDNKEFVNPNAQKNLKFIVGFGAVVWILLSYLSKTSDIFLGISSITNLLIMAVGGCYIIIRYFNAKESGH